jgi:hypothetical protein
VAIAAEEVQKQAIKAGRFTKNKLQADEQAPLLFRR